MRSPPKLSSDSERVSLLLPDIPKRSRSVVADVTIARCGQWSTNLVNARIRWGSQSLSPSSSSLWSRWQEAIYLSSLCATRQAEGRKQTRLAHIIRDDEICPPLFCSFLSIQLLSLPEFRTDTLLIICDLIKGLQ